ncbi:hypothetical protein [Paenibacillus montanisoli]|uniref:hypothetical protein n=1 Tax=Paenibacillus montanisoli TaxID=2081970 RepID=UPI001401C4C5|nr:hypothetical protein [Paenibacillus montanisoli]
MNYKPAELDGQQLAQLQQFETELREQISSNIVLVAYQISAESEGTGAAAAGK